MEEQAAFGQLEELAHSLAVKAAKPAGVKVTTPRPVQIIQLLPFARAHKALLAGKPAVAARELMSADPLIAARLPPAAEIADAVLAIRSLEPELRMEAALVAGDARVAHQLAKSFSTADDTRELAFAAHARAHIAQLKLADAESDLEHIKVAKRPATLLARAQLAHARGDTGSRDIAIASLLSGPTFFPALSWIATLSPGSLGSSEPLVLSHSSALITRPELASALGARAAASGESIEQALALISVFYLSSETADDLSAVLETALASDTPGANRLTAAAALLRGETETARDRLVAAIDEPNHHPETSLLLARMHAEAERHDQAVQLLEAARNNGPFHQREYARALSRAGKDSQALDAMTNLPPKGSIEVHMARAERALANGKPAGAVASLERAAFESPDNIALLSALVRAYHAAGAPSRGDATGAFVRRLSTIATPEGSRAAGSNQRGDVAALSPPSEEPAESSPLLPALLLILATTSLAFGVYVVRRRRQSTPEEKPATAPTPSPIASEQSGRAKVSAGPRISAGARVSAGAKVSAGDAGLPQLIVPSETPKATEEADFPELPQLDSSPVDASSRDNTMPDALELPSIEYGATEFQLGSSHGSSGLTRRPAALADNPLAHADPLGLDTELEAAPVASPPRKTEPAPARLGSKSDVENPFAMDNPLESADDSDLLHSASQISARRAYVGYDEDPLEARMDIHLGGDTKASEAPDNASEDDDPLGFGTISVSKTLGTPDEENR